MRRTFQTRFNRFLGLQNDFNRVPRIPLVVRNRRANEINFFFKDLKTQENYMFPNYLSWSHRGRSCTPFIPRAHAYDYSLMFAISTVTAADRRGRARGEIKRKIKCGQPVLRRERPPVRSTHYGLFGLPPENPAQQLDVRVIRYLQSPR